MGQAFAAAGAEIWVTDLDVSQVPDGWRASKVDASDEVAMGALFAEIDADWGQLDVVCANAGIAGPTALIEDVALTDWQRCVSVNLEGAFLTAKYAAPLMKRQCAGALVLTSSTAGIYGYPNRAPYSAAKWGDHRLDENIGDGVGAAWHPRQCDLPRGS